MKEIVLSVKRQKTEIKIFCVCIALAYLMNIISIIAYGTSWSELCCGCCLSRVAFTGCRWYSVCCITECVS